MYIPTSHYRRLLHKVNVSGKESQTTVDPSSDLQEPVVIDILTHDLVQFVGAVQGCDISELLSSR